MTDYQCRNVVEIMSVGASTLKKKKKIVHVKYKKERKRINNLLIEVEILTFNNDL